MTAQIALIIHPIDTDRHPTVPPGFRWAVMVDNRRPEELDRCAEARWCPTLLEAQLEGEMVAVTVAKAFRLCGMPGKWFSQVLDYDPIPAEADALGLAT